jgi:hypothetical protein
MRDTKRWAVGCATLLAAACGSDPSGPTVPEPPASTPLQLALTQRFLEEFGESVPRPAVFVPTLAEGSTCDWHVTSTAYVPTSGNRSMLFTLYTSGDGNSVRLATSLGVLRPAGVIRVLVAFITYPQTTSGAGLALWEDAQDQINSDMKDFARTREFVGPIVTFQNTNATFNATEALNPRTRSDVAGYLAGLGYDAADYDVVVSVNIDPTTTEGGFASIGGDFVYMGNFLQSTSPLTASDYGFVARAVYYHEFAHLWGWPGTHDWTECHSAGLDPFGYRFFVPPLLLGWEDVDGDGVPEILDSTPYGRAGP